MKLLEKLTQEGNNKKKIENIIFLIAILIITLLVMNYIWKDQKNNNNEKNSEYNKTLAKNELEENMQKDELSKSIEDILVTIKGVGKVKVLLNYSESSSLIPLYDETTTTSNTEEEDQAGGIRNVTQTESKKDIVFSEQSGSKEPITQKTLVPVIQGAIVTAEGAQNAKVKTDIVDALKALTGLSIDRIQVYEMK